MSNHRTCDPDQLAAVFKALAHPQRLRIFLKLASCCGGHSSCDATTNGVRRCVGDLEKTSASRPPRSRTI